MRQIALFILLTIATPLTLFAHGSGSHHFSEGSHYEVLPNPATAKPVVTEYFSFFCGHCFRFEPLMGEVKKSLPKGVKFEKSHVDFLPRNQEDIANLYSKALYTAQILDVEEKVVAKLFEAVHIKRETFNTEAQLQKVFAEVGIPEEKFKAAFNGFMANGAVGEMQKAQQQAKLSSVPTIIVNGKYKVVTQQIKSAEEYIRLVNYLTTLK